MLIFLVIKEFLLKKKKIYNNNIIKIPEKLNYSLSLIRKEEKLQYMFNIKA